MLICDATVNGRIIGEAETEAEACAALRAWGAPLHVSVPGAVVRDCLLAEAHGAPGRTVRAWVVATQPADVLASVAESIWGRDWQSPLSRAVGVSDRTVRYWAARSRPVPDGVLLDLRDWLILESDRLRGIAGRVVL